jgi:hypothetical protein
MNGSFFIIAPFFNMVFLHISRVQNKLPPIPESLPPIPLSGMAPSVCSLEICERQRGLVLEGIEVLVPEKFLSMVHVGSGA